MPQMFRRFKNFHLGHTKELYSSNTAQSWSKEANDFICLIYNYKFIGQSPQNRFWEQVKRVLFILVSWWDAMCDVISQIRAIILLS